MRVKQVPPFFLALRTHVRASPLKTIGLDVQPLHLNFDHLYGFPLLSGLTKKHSVNKLNIYCFVIICQFLL